MDGRFGLRFGHGGGTLFQVVCLHHTAESADFQFDMDDWFVGECLSGISLDFVTGFNVNRIAGESTGVTCGRGDGDVGQDLRSVFAWEVLSDFFSLGQVFLDLIKICHIAFCGARRPLVRSPAATRN